MTWNEFAKTWHWQPGPCSGSTELCFADLELRNLMRAEKEGQKGIPDVNEAYLLEVASKEMIRLQSRWNDHERRLDNKSHVVAECSYCAEVS